MILLKVITLCCLFGIGSSVCRQGYKCYGDQIPGKCFKEANHAEVMFDVASGLCAADGTYVVSIHSQKEANDLDTVPVLSYTQGHYWVGLVCNVTSGEYYYQDGTDSSFPLSSPYVSKPCDPTQCYHYHGHASPFVVYGCTGSGGTAARAVCYHLDPDCQPAGYTPPSTLPTTIPSTPEPTPAANISACGDCSMDSVWLDIFFLVDSSSSMAKNGLLDVRSTIRTTLTNLNMNRTEVRAGIIVYANEAEVVYGLNSINSEDIAVNIDLPFKDQFGTNIEAAIVTAMGQYNVNPPAKKSRKAIVLFASSYRESEDYASPTGMAYAFKYENGIIITVDYSGIITHPLPILDEVASPGYELVKNDDIVEQFEDAFCDANCFCPNSFAKYTAFSPVGCTGRCVPSGGCFQGVGLASNQKQAERDCISKGGHLASVHNDDTQQFLSTLFPSRKMYWLGLGMPSQTWTDGTPFDYSHWAPSQPASGNGCVYSQQYSGFKTGWYTQNCAKDLSYVCEAPPCSAHNRNCNM